MQFIQAQRSLGIDSPILIFVTLIGVRHAALGFEHLQSTDQRFDRDVVAIPELLVKADTELTQGLFETTVDTIWQAAGWRKSLYKSWDGR